MEWLYYIGQMVNITQRRRCLTSAMERATITGQMFVGEWKNDKCNGKGVFYGKDEQKVNIMHSIKYHSHKSPFQCNPFVPYCILFTK